MRSLHTVQQSTPLTQALQLLLDAGVSALPVVNEVSIFPSVHLASRSTADLAVLASVLLLFRHSSTDAQAGAVAEGCSCCTQCTPAAVCGASPQPCSADKTLALQTGVLAAECAGRPLEPEACKCIHTALCKAVPMTQAA